MSFATRDRVNQQKRDWLLQNLKLPVACQFYLDGKPLEFLDSYSQLGHIITNTLSDSQDIIHRRGCLAGQINR